MAYKQRKVPVRSLEVVRVDIVEALAAQNRLRALVQRQMRILKAARFKPVGPDGKRNPAFKMLREVESTLRSADRHLARLRAEEAKILQQAGDTAPNAWSEFSQPPQVANGD